MYLLVSVSIKLIKKIKFVVFGYTFYKTEIIKLLKTT